MAAQVHILDINAHPRTIASFVLETEEGPVLFETGPYTAAERLRQALAQLGYAPSQVRHVFVTHVHLDHAGGAWSWAREGAKIYVHPRGLPHLADPSRLWASASRIYGDQMEALWGSMAPIDPAQLVPLEDGAQIRLGGVEIEAWETLGHAPHHLAFRLGDALIAGDIAGVRIEGGPALPPCPPPDIHLELWQASLERLRRASLASLYLTHFGRVDDVQEHLADLAKTLDDWGRWILERLRQGRSQEELIPEFEAYVRGMLEARGMSQEEIEAYEVADPAWMSVGGLVRYWSKIHPEALA
jgi:glyoxylase-like metal-dependent hydrolase (beta-lactamase superfamily II)